MINKNLYVILIIITSCGDYETHLNSELNTYYCYMIEESLFNPKMPHLSAPKKMLQESDFNTYCKKELLTESYPGEISDDDKWKLSLGSGLLISSYDQTKNHMPFVKEIEYKRTNNCILSMKIYVKDLSDLKKNRLKPLIFFHGGGWAYRKLTASTAIDVTVPNITERNYVVFSPVHRLISDKEGNNNCQNASGEEVLEDVTDSFTWVTTHMNTYGVEKDSLVSLAGHSSGGHLATYLAINKAPQIDKVLLFYPVTDFNFMVDNLKAGGLYENDYLESRHLLYNFIGSINNKELIEKNSFPKIIEKDPSRYPLFYMLHGIKDSISPVEMSSRLCSSLNGSLPTPQHRYLYKKSLNFCNNRGSVFFSIEKGEHMLELKCLDHFLTGIIPLDFSRKLSCSAGNPDNELEVIKALDYAYNDFL